MQLTLLQAKLHNAVVTGKDLAYHGSLTIDEDLIDAAGMLPGQQIQVYDGNNGKRFETYIIRGPRGSGEIHVNGPAARLVEIGDRIIVVSFAQFSPEEAAQFSPTVIVCDADNRVLETIAY